MGSLDPVPRARAFPLKRAHKLCAAGDMGEEIWRVVLFWPVGADPVRPFDGPGMAVGSG